MTVMTTIPAVQATTIEEVMSVGVCAACRKPVASHIDAEKTWVGCAAASADAPSGHPLRRATDIVVMVPVSMIQSAVTAAFVPTMNAPSEVRSATGSRAKGTTRYATRGKPSGRYVVTGRVPAKMTESINRVYFAMKGVKKGIVAKELAERLGMPDGTLAWVLTQLQKQGSIVHVRPGEHANDLIAKSKAAVPTR